MVFVGRDGLFFLNCHMQTMNSERYWALSILQYQLEIFLLLTMKSKFIFSWWESRFCKRKYILNWWYLLKEKFLKTTNLARSSEMLWLPVQKMMSLWENKLFVNYFHVHFYHIKLIESTNAYYIWSHKPIRSTYTWNNHTALIPAIPWRKWR